MKFLTGFSVATSGIFLLILLGGFPAHGQSPNGILARPGLRFNLDEVRYVGDDTYQIRLRFENETGRTVVSGSFIHEISVQSEVIGQWITLPAGRTDVSGAAGSDLPRVAREKGCVLVVRIPTSLQHLYRNMDGEMNVRIVSRLIDDPPTGTTELPLDPERTYWVLPESEQWILREGM